MHDIRKRVSGLYVRNSDRYVQYQIVLHDANQLETRVQVYVGGVVIFSRHVEYVENEIFIFVVMVRYSFDDYPLRDSSKRASSTFCDSI